MTTPATTYTGTTKEQLRKLRIDVTIYRARLALAQFEEDEHTDTGLANDILESLAAIKLTNEME